MKKTKFTEAQIVFALKQSESAVAVAEYVAKWALARLPTIIETGTPERKKYGGLGVAELHRLRQREAEAARRKTVS